MKCDKEVMEEMQMNLDEVQNSLNFTVYADAGIQSSIQRLKNVLQSILDNIEWEDKTDNGVSPAEAVELVHADI